MNGAAWFGGVLYSAGDEETENGDHPGISAGSGNCTADHGAKGSRAWSGHHLSGSAHRTQGFRREPARNSQPLRQTPAAGTQEAALDVRSACQQDSNNSQLACGPQEVALSASSAPGARLGPARGARIMAMPCSTGDLTTNTSSDSSGASTPASATAWSALAMTKSSCALFMSTPCTAWKLAPSDGQKR